MILFDTGFLDVNNLEQFCVFNSRHIAVSDFQAFGLSNRGFNRERLRTEERLVIDFEII